MSYRAAVELSPEAIAFVDSLATGQNPPSELDAARIQAEQVHLATTRKMARRSGPNTNSIRMLTVPPLRGRSSRMLR